MEKHIYVAIPKAAGDPRTEIGEDQLLAAAGQGAAIGGTIGSIVPGVGTAIGSTVGAIVGGLGDLFGIFGKAPRTKDVMRKILINGFVNALPGKVRETGGDHSYPILVGAYSAPDIRAAIDAIGRSVLDSLDATSDAYRNLSRAFNSYELSEVDRPYTQGWYTVMEFDQASFSNPSTGNDNAMRNPAAGIGLAVAALVAALGS